MGVGRIGRGAAGRFGRDSVIVTPPPPAPSVGWDGVQSPTGRNPIFIANSARQAVWNQMWSDYQANPSSPATRGGILAKQTKEAALLGAGYYANIGQYAVHMYQMTGDATWAQLAYSQIQGWWLTFSPYPSTDVNIFRDWAPMHVIMLDWLWPGLTPTQRTTLYDSLVGHVNATITLYGGGWNEFVKSGDSDQVLGHYFALVLLHLFDTSNTTIAALYNMSGTGGLDATATDHSSTARNFIKQIFSVFSEGGEPPESSEYNPRTYGHDCIPNIEAVLTATGAEHFPEYRAWLPTYALNLMAHWTPDLELNYQWGDEQTPYSPNLNDWANTCRQVAGVLQGTAQGQQLQQFIFDMETKWGLENGSTTSFEPFQPGRWFLTYNPYSSAQEWKTDTNRSHYSPGKGMLMHKSGYGVSDSMFMVDSGQWLLDAAQGGFWVQHLVEYFMNHLLYKNGEFVLKHPFAYNGVSVRGAGTNVPLMHGINGCYEYRRVQHHALDATSAYITATTGGSMQDKLYDVPNDTIAVHEWTRSLTRFTGLTDVIICADRADVRAIGNINNYRAQMTIALAPRNRITGSSSPLVSAPFHPKQLIWHTPVSPTIAGQNISWTTSGGQAMKLVQLLPTTTLKQIRDELALYSAGEYDWISTPNLPTFASHVVIYPSTLEDFDFFLSVIYAGTPGVATLKQNGGWSGVHATVPGGDDVLVMHNSTAGPALSPLTPHDPAHIAQLQVVRFRNVGATISWTGVGPNTVVKWNDLDPTHSWTVNKDGAGVVSLTVDSGGQAAFTMTGTGAHSLVLA